MGGKSDAAVVSVDPPRGLPLARLPPRAAGAHTMDTMVSHRAAVHRAVLAMSEHLEEDLSLHDLARVAFISPYHFNRTFRQVVGIPPCKFLGALRLQSAKRQLASGSLSVTEICFGVGYNSLGTFIRRFTSLVGLSPRRFRALARSGEGIQPPLAALLGAVGRSLPPSGSLHGQVGAPAGFSGIILVGLFNSSIPEGVPVRCAILAAPGPFTLAPVADGTYYLMAIGMSGSANPRDSLVGEALLRSDRSARVEIRGGVASLLLHLTLREPELIDPPILVSLPILIAGRWRAAEALKDALDDEHHRVAASATQRPDPALSAAMAGEV